MKNLFLPAILLTFIFTSCEQEEIVDQCGNKTTCSQMTSCEEAKYYLNNCGVSSLDADNDGIPCESLCQ